MRIIKRILIGIVMLAILLAIIGMLLPRDVSVTRSTIINASSDKVFPYINNLKTAEKWSPWLAHDPETKLTYTGAETGVGAKMAWASEHPNVGSGSQEITVSEPNKTVVTALDFGDMGNAKARFDLNPSGVGTQITWSFKTDMGAGPIGRWFGLMMDDWVGTDYEQGLQNLKTLVEREN